MNYLFDTDVLIDFLKKKEPSFSILKKLLNEKNYISIISWSEIVYGIKKSYNPDKNLLEFSNFLKSFSITIVPVDEKIAYQFIELKIFLEKDEQSLADFDLFIAASVIIHDLVLITRNIKHFSRIKNLKIYS